MSADERPYAVVYTKRPGVVVVFNTCATQAAAEKLVAGLATIGCKARIVSAKADDLPGTQRRRTTAHA